MNEHAFYRLLTQLVMAECEGGLAPPTPDTDLWNGGYLDSLGLLSVLVALEEAAGIEVPASNSISFRTMREMWDGICGGVASAERTRG